MDVLVSDIPPGGRGSRVALFVVIVISVALVAWIGWRVMHQPGGASPPRSAVTNVTHTPRPIVLLPDPTPPESPRPSPSISAALAQRAMAALTRQVPTAERTSFEVVAGYPYTAAGELAELDIASKAGTRVVHFLCLGSGGVSINVKSDLQLRIACTSIAGHNVAVSVSNNVDTIVLTYDCREGTLGALAYRVSRS